MDHLVLGQLGLVIVLVAEVVDHFCRDPLVFDDQILLAMMVASRTSWVTSTVFIADLKDELLHLGSGQGIKGSEGFVQKQELGRGQEGSG